MPELPKFVLDRLRTGEAAAAEHPSADLLSAFAEHSLIGNERKHVLEHLGKCATCREVISLAQPEAAAHQVVITERRHWFWAPAFRFATVAAVFAVVVAGVVLYRGRETVPAEQKVAEAKIPAAPQLKQEETSNARVVSETATPEAKAKSPAERMLDDGHRGELGRLEARHTRQKEQAESNLLADKITVKNAQAELDAAASNQAIRGRESAQTFARKAKIASNAPYSLPAKVESTSRAGAVGGVLGKPAAGVITGSSPAADVKAQVAHQVGMAERPAREDETALAAANKVRAQSSLDKDLFTPALGKKTTATPVRWTVSASGGLLRSVDGGRTWQPMYVADKITFRAIASIPPDVWAGGMHGALYYSENAGTRWQRLTVWAAGTELKDDIVALNFSDPQHGKLTTATGAVWITSDGCRSWQKQP